MCVRGIASELDRSFFQRSLSNGMTRQLRLTTHASLMAEQMLTNLKKKSFFRAIGGAVIRVVDSVLGSFGLEQPRTPDRVSEGGRGPHEAACG